MAAVNCSSIGGMLRQGPHQRAQKSTRTGRSEEAGVPVISWIGCPQYLLDGHDTLDKVEKSELKPITEAGTELIGIHLMTP